MPIIDDPGLISFSKREKASHTAHTPQASNLKGENKYARQAENPTSHAKPTACMPCTPELSLHTSSKRVYFSDSVRENYLRNNRSGVKPVEREEPAGSPNEEIARVRRGPCSVRACRSVSVTALRCRSAGHGILWQLTSACKYCKNAPRMHLLHRIKTPCMPRF